MRLLVLNFGFFFMFGLLLALFLCLLCILLCFCEEVCDVLRLSFNILFSLCTQFVLVTRTKPCSAFY
jgi:hypothetical protein